jgi:hypothetical protein
MHFNQSWPPVISPLGVHPCFRNTTRAKQGCCRDWQGHTVLVSIGSATWVPSITTFGTSKQARDGKSRVLIRIRTPDCSR